MKDKAIPYDRHQQRQKAAKSFRLKHSTIIIMKGFDKGVGDITSVQPQTLAKLHCHCTGESEILYVPFPLKSLAYKHIES